MAHDEYLTCVYAPSPHISRSFHQLMPSHSTILVCFESMQMRGDFSRYELLC